MITFNWNVNIFLSLCNKMLQVIIFDLNVED